MNYENVIEIAWPVNVLIFICHM